MPQRTHQAGEVTMSAFGEQYRTIMIEMAG
jgi:hypothetical protein